MRFFRAIVLGFALVLAVITPATASPHHSAIYTEHINGHAVHYKMVHGLKSIQSIGPKNAVQPQWLLDIVDTTNPQYWFCLHNGQSYCANSNGVGNQYTLTQTDADKAKLEWDQETNGYFEFPNASGNCMRVADTGGAVNTTSGCTPGGNQQEWVILSGGGGSFEFFSHSDQNYMVTAGAVVGYKLWVSTNDSGNWFRWDTFCRNC